ncbi:MAG: hypothetical protein ACKPKO_22190, partial [Candidatus Fonsibacter sp.]
LNVSAHPRWREDAHDDDDDDEDYEDDDDDYDGWWVTMIDDGWPLNQRSIVGIHGILFTCGFWCRRNDWQQHYVSSHASEKGSSHA